MTDTPFNDPLSQVVRRQLQDLRIDPDATLTNRRSVRFVWLKAWCGRHKQGLAIVSAIGMVLFFLTGILTVVTMVASGPSGSSPRNAPRSVTVSLGDATVIIDPPAYRRFSLAEGSVLLHLDVRNTAAVQTRLLAGDLLLADRRGALFPPSWHDVDGTPVDGVSDPMHVLVGLDPGADVAIDLQFLVLTEGPFTLRYQRQERQQNAELPSLTLTKGS